MYPSHGKHGRLASCLFFIHLEFPGALPHCHADKKSPADLEEKDKKIAELEAQLKKSAPTTSTDEAKGKEDAEGGGGSPPVKV